MINSQIKTYSATDVFPAEVCADTNTDWLLSIQETDCCWKPSSSNLYSLAGFPVRGLKTGSSASDFKKTTSWEQFEMSGVSDLCLICGMSFNMLQVIHLNLKSTS